MLLARDRDIDEVYLRYCLSSSDGLEQSISVPDMNMMMMMMMAEQRPPPCPNLSVS